MGCTMALKEQAVAATIEEALATAVAPSLRPVSTIDAEIDALGERCGSLLGVEQEQADTIRSRIAQLEQDRVASLFVEGRPEPPRLLSPEVLAWRHAKRIKGIPVPKLAPLSTDRPVCRFAASRLSFVRLPSYANSVPGSIESYYADVQEGMGRRVARWRTRSVELSWRFEGVIPDDVRQRIVLYMGDFEKEDIILLADAPLETWRYRERRREPDELRRTLLDPLVIGVKAGRLWLLDAFDPTPIESYVTDEFSEKSD